MHAKAAGLYMICTISKHAAEAKGFGDALMLDYRGYLAETTGANVFFVIDGEIHTPKPDCFLNGITRRTVIDLAQEARHQRHRAAHPARRAAGRAGVLRHRHRRRGDAGARDRRLNFQLGPITRQLIDDYHGLTRGHARAA